MAWRVRDPDGYSRYAVKCTTCWLWIGFPTRAKAQQHLIDLSLSGYSVQDSDVFQYVDGSGDTCAGHLATSEPVTPHGLVPPERPVEDRIRALGAEGLLFPEDLPALTAAKRAIYMLMRDGRWHSAHEIRDVAAGGQSEGLRRLRELRDYGFTIDKRREGRMFWYRLVVSPKALATEP